MSQDQKPDERLQALARLTAGMSHDFNNVLAIITGYVHMMSKDGATDADIKDGLAKIKSAAERGTQMSKTIAQFGNHSPQDYPTIDLVDCLSGLEAELKFAVPDNIQVTFVYSISHAPVAGSYREIANMLEQLISNAFDEIGSSEGCIRIELKDEEGDIVLSVSDTGDGIDVDKVQYVFDPFYTTKLAKHHKGLGLSLVYGQMRQHSGQVHVMPEPKEGATIKLVFPYSDEPIVQSQEDFKDTPYGCNLLGGKTILIVDDEPHVLDMVVESLASIDLKVLKAVNGDDALLVQDEYEGKIDVLLSDIVMPGMDGLKLAELMTALRPETKVAFMTGDADRLAQAQKNSAVVLQKPIDLDGLTSVIQEIILQKDGSDLSNSTTKLGRLNADN